MREYSFRKDGFTFERVSKATARRVFNNDMPIMLCPCNLRPETGLFSTVTAQAIAFIILFFMVILLPKSYSYIFGNWYIVS